MPVPRQLPCSPMLMVLIACRFLAISVELLQYSVSYWLNSAFWSPMVIS